MRRLPGDAWENSRRERFNARFCDEVPNGEISYSLPEAQMPVEKWRTHGGINRHQVSLGYCRRAPKPSPTWTRGRSSI